MFNSKKKTETVNTGIINTIIGDNSKIEGVLTASESTRILPQSLSAISETLMAFSP